MSGGSSTRWGYYTPDNTVFWLKGLAGTGKSTIARAIARKYFEWKYLGASFSLLKRWWRC
jgi:adenylylsulfate kinase-like enzyme